MVESSRNSSVWYLPDLEIRFPRLCAILMPSALCMVNRCEERWEVLSNEAARSELLVFQSTLAFRRCADIDVSESHLSLVESLCTANVVTLSRGAN